MADVHERGLAGAAHACVWVGDGAGVPGAVEVGRERGDSVEDEANRQRNLRARGPVVGDELGGDITGTYLRTARARVEVELLAVGVRAQKPVRDIGADELAEACGGVE